MTEGSSKNCSESTQHHLIKNYFLNNIPLINDVKDIGEEVVVGNRIADVLVELCNSERVAIEIQHSKISEFDIIRRTKDYNKEKCHVLWILNGESHYRYPKIEQAIVILKSEIYLQRMYEGRVYYVNASELKLKHGVYPLHFCRIQEKINDYYGLTYFRQSRSKRSVIPGKIYSLKLVLYRNLGFRLARFMDKNVRRECINTIKEFLDPHDIFDDEVLYDLLSSYKDKFGLYLLYDCLKYLKIMNKKQFPKMFHLYDILERNEILRKKAK